MSTTRIYKITTTETETIASNADFLKAIKSLDEVLLEKLKRLTSCLKGTKIQVKEGTFFINDKYGTLQNLEQELSAFGFTVEKVAGNMYKASDLATGLLDLLKPDRMTILAGGVFFRTEMDDILKEKVKHLKGIELPEIMALKNNPTLMKIIDNIRNGGNYTVSDTIEKQGEEYAHDEVHFEKRLGTERIVSRETNIHEGKQAYEQLNNVITCINGSHKENLINGTKVLINNRAKAMGRTVEMKEDGSKIHFSITAQIGE